jgi:hypothetical protein
MCKYCCAVNFRITPLDDNELALLARLKGIHDTAKLAAKLPAWIKTHNRLTAAPKPFVFKPNQPPVYPSWVLACGKSEPQVLHIPDVREKESMADYVRRFEEANLLKAAEVTP